MARGWGGDSVATIALRVSPRLPGDLAVSLPVLPNTRPLRWCVWDGWFGVAQPWRQCA